MQYILTDRMNTLSGGHTIADNIFPYIYIYFKKRLSMSDVPRLQEKCGSSKGGFHLYLSIMHLILTSTKGIDSQPY